MFVMLDKRYSKHINCAAYHIKRERGRTVKKIDISRLQPKFIGLVEQYMADNDLTQEELARMVRMQRTHLNMLLNGKRKLSGYYAVKFIQRGIMSVADLYDGNAETKKEREFWDDVSAVFQDTELLRQITRLQKKGFDVKSILRGIEAGADRKNGK